MIIDLGTFLTPEEIIMCDAVAKTRLDEKRRDTANGDFRASYSNGQAGTGNERTYDREFEDSKIGAMGELIACKATKTTWTKEIGQYKGNDKPDLFFRFDGKLVKGEARGTRRSDSIIYRRRDKLMNSGKALIAVTNLPTGPICEVRFASFNFLEKLVNQHPEWAGSKTGHPYYNIPIEYFTADFSRVGP